MTTPPKKPLMGILLCPESTRQTRDGVFQTDCYGFKVGKWVPGLRKKGILFISTPAIREKIDELKVRPGHPVGRFEYILDHKFKYIVLNVDYPISSDIRFQHLGIGSMAENLLEKKYTEKYPNYQATTSREANGNRKMQLLKRGRDWRDAIPIAEARELTRKYVVKEHQKWLAKNRRPPPRRA